MKEGNIPEDETTIAETAKEEESSEPFEALVRQKCSVNRPSDWFFLIHSNRRFSSASSSSSSSSFR